MKINELFESEYRGSHEAPNNNGYDKPIYDVTGIYPDDIYSSNAAQLYGDGLDYDYESINIIQSVRNKPKSAIKIYRAVPYDNTNDKYIKSLKDLLAYQEKFKFFPINNKIIDELESKYRDLSYNDQVKSVHDDIQQQIAQSSKREKVSINNGDWVTISRSYAVDHGRDHLRNKYKIITKTVSARHLWTDGNSIHEWGYDIT